MKRKRRHGPRQRWFFYLPEQTPSAAGTLSRDDPTTTDPVLSGFFNTELAKKPIEISDSSVNFGQIQWVLIGTWFRHLENSVTSEMLAWCPETDRVMEVLARPVDMVGDRLEAFIYVVENVRRNIDTSQLSTNY